MIDVVKPGHVLKFGTDPKTINSPHGLEAKDNDNTLLTAWPSVSTLGTVQCISHPAGPIGKIAADVSTRLRTTSNSLSRIASYSMPGRLMTEQTRVLGSEACDFVGYGDGQTNYVRSTRTVFSKDFSGCLMAVYSVNGERHVAHVAASSIPRLNCKQAFLNVMQTQSTTPGMNVILRGWFRPYVDVTDMDRKLAGFRVVGKYIQENIAKLTTFGVVTQAGNAYSVLAFKPDGTAGSEWVVTDVQPKTMSTSFVAP